MKLMALDTSTAVAGVALIDGDTLVCEYNLQAGLTHSQRLMPLVDHAMEMACWKRDELEMLAVVTGPGSFTGIRIGIATACGIAFALGIPIVPVCTLEALAYNVPFTDAIIVPLCDARRGQVYAGAYRWDGDRLIEVFAPCAMEISQFFDAERLRGQKIVTLGDGARANREFLESLPQLRFAPAWAFMQHSGAVAALALQKAAACAALPAHEIRAQYQRKSQAEQAREARMGAANG